MTGLRVRRGSAPRRGPPGAAFDETQEQAGGGTPLYVPVAQPTAALVTLVDDLAVDDEVLLGGLRYRVIAAPPRRAIDVYRTVLIEEVR